ncbi:hypothetical protein VPNG_00341 [Cytospora leucostoma]|uniref:Uncharacterized protein n=1 Tax=Cytospora leucostoma TaxID=1230097 RepID=A0A423XNX0_9PEZI|nr:hypothetical protein VPNG_00341 [Cytospora leucostoma]
MPLSASHDAGGSGSSSASQRGAQDAETSNPRETEQELAQQAATALEANLTSLESKLDELLASIMSATDAVSPTTNGAEKSAAVKEEDDTGTRVDKHDG